MASQHDRILGEQPMACAFLTAALQGLGAILSMTDRIEVIEASVSSWLMLAQGVTLRPSVTILMDGEIATDFLEAGGSEEAP